MLDLSSLDLEEIANALADQEDYEHHWLIDPDTGEIAFWTADTGIDGQAPVDLDELDRDCCVSRSQMAGDWSGDYPPHDDFGVRWLPVPA